MRMRKFPAVFLALLFIVSSLACLIVSADDIPEDMPSVPAEEVQYVCPYEVLTAHTLQWAEYSGESAAILDWFTNDPLPGTLNFTGINFGYPYPSSNVTVLEDKLWINELVSTNLDTLLGFGPDIDIAPLMVLDADTMTTNQTELYNYLITGVIEWITNGTIVDRSWFPSYLLDFRVYYSSYVNLEVFNKANITVFGFGITNCSRETYWQEESSFLYSYYTTQKKYEVTLQIENTISTSDYYDVNWYVGFPANKLVDPSTLSVYDLDNDMYLTLGQHYDASNAGVWMSFTHINISAVRSFKFTIYSWNATIGVGGAIAYTDSYIDSQLGGVDYFLAEPSWTNEYGRAYQGMVIIQLSFVEGEQRYIDPSSVSIYDNVDGRYLESWEFAISSGMIIIDYATVNVGDVQSYKVYFALDYAEKTGNITLQTEIVDGVPLWLVIVIGVVAAIIAYIFSERGTLKRSISGSVTVVLISIMFILWYFQSVGVM